MKLVTLNLRGVGSIAKQKRVGRLTRRESFDVCFFQETKRGDIDIAVVTRLWGGDDFEWFAQPSNGLSGGILTVWRRGLFVYLFSFSNPGFVGIAAQMDGRTIYLVNVYSGCAVRRIRELWSQLMVEKGGLNPGSWVIGGDFNTITRQSDRRGKSVRFSNAEPQDFGFFMAEMGVVEPTCLGKKFTWYQPNGPAASRIDKLLLAQELIDLWGIKSQWIGERDVSDYCPVWSLSSNKNWGPKPFKFINGWLDHKDGKLFIEEKWKELKVDGWMAHIVKEKLKFVKERLKRWNKEVYGAQNLNIDKVVKEMNELEENGGEAEYWDEDRWRGLNSEFWKNLHHGESLLAQKAKARWI